MRPERGPPTIWAYGGRTNGSVEEGTRWDLERGEGKCAFGDVDCPESERVEVGEQPSRGTMLRWWESEWRFASSQRQAEEDQIQFVKEQARARGRRNLPRFGVWRSRLDGIMGAIPAWGKSPRGTCASNRSTASIIQNVLLPNSRSRTSTLKETPGTCIEVL